MTSSEDLRSEAQPRWVAVGRSDTTAAYSEKYDLVELLAGINGRSGGVPLVGCSGDRVPTDAVVAAAIASDAPVGIGIRHGWRTVGEPMLVTTSSANRVFSLDHSCAGHLRRDRTHGRNDAFHNQTLVILAVS